MPERTYPCCDCCATDLPHIERDQHTVPCHICHPSPVQRARMAAAWDEGYRQAVTDHLLQYDNSDDTPNPYRSGDPR